MRRTTVAIGIAVMGLAIAACGDGSGSGTLVVYSGRAEELVQPLIDTFVDETGIDVEVRYASSPELAATLIAEGEATEADQYQGDDGEADGGTVGDGQLAKEHGTTPIRGE